MVTRLKKLAAVLSELEHVVIKAAALLLLIASIRDIILAKLKN
jgi:hypothetical protein